jgi:hypothetical protein
MNERALWLLGLLICLITLITACGGGQTAADRYRELVLDTLRGDPLAGTGLGQIMAEMVGDLGCEGESCILAMRFQYLREQAYARQLTVADYHGRLCDNRRVRIPKELSDQHRILCEELSALFSALDAIRMNSSDALRLIMASDQESTSLESLLQQFSHRLDRKRQEILDIREKLRVIEWLKPILAD